MSTPVTPLLPRFGRQWSVDVRVPSGWITLSDSSKEETQLNVEFDIWKPSNYAAFWYADISVYNLDEKTEQQLLSEGMEVIVNAGYEHGQFGEIFRGRVFQPMWERKNVVDFKTTLRCLVGREVLTEGMVIANTTAFATQDDIIRQIARSQHSSASVWQNGKRAPIDWEQNLNLSPSLRDKKLERGKVMFGSPRKYLEQIARDRFMQVWYDSNDQVNVQDITSNPDQNVIVYTPQTGLVGTPQQTQEGVSFRVLLDPRLDVTYPAKQVKLDMTSIQLLKRTIGELPGFLDKNNQYIVAGVRHVGMTRGNDWYTEVIGVTSAYGKLSLLSGLIDTPSTVVDINH